MPLTPGTPLYTLADVFRKAFADVLSQVLATPWTVEAKDEAPAAEADAMHFALTPSGVLQGNAGFQLSKSDARSLGQKLLNEPSDASSELNEAHKKAIEDLLRKIAEKSAYALKIQFGDAALQLASSDAPAWSGENILLAASTPPNNTLSLIVQMSKEFVASLPAPVDDRPTPRPEMPSTGDSNLDLILGVDLSLTLRFGQRTLTLREILELSSGSVVELDRRVQEPADLLLGDKLIARGEVVIVDSNYGLRITEVCDHGAAKHALSVAQ